MEEGVQVVDDISQEVSNSWQTISSLIDGFFALLPKIGIAAVVFILMIVVASLVRAGVHRALSGKASKNLGIAVGRLVHIAVIFVGFLLSVAIVAPSVSAAELLSVLGIGSVAIGFAFKDILQNFLAGILILLNEPFKIGHWVRFSEYEGMVQDISARETWIRTFDGRDVAIPNGEIFTNPITIVNRDPLIRTDYDIGISYDADIEKAIDVIVEAVSSVDEISYEKSPDAGVIDLASSSVNIRARWWTTSEDVYAARIKVLRAVKDALDKQGINIPYPHRQLLMPEKVTEALEANSS